MILDMLEVAAAGVSAAVDDLADDEDGRDRLIDLTLGADVYVSGGIFRSGRSKPVSAQAVLSVAGPGEAVSRVPWLRMAAAMASLGVVIAIPHQMAAAGWAALSAVLALLLDSESRESARLRASQTATVVRRIKVTPAPGGTVAQAQARIIAAFEDSMGGDR